MKKIVSHIKVYGKSKSLQTWDQSLKKEVIICIQLYNQPWRCYSLEKMLTWPRLFTWVSKEHLLVNIGSHTLIRLAAMMVFLDMLQVYRVYMVYIHEPNYIDMCMRIFMFMQLYGRINKKQRGLLVSPLLPPQLPC